MERRSALYTTFDTGWWTDGTDPRGAVPYAPETLANARLVLSDIDQHFPEAEHTTPMPGTDGEICLEWVTFACSLTGNDCFVWLPEKLECDLKLPTDLARLRGLFAQSSEGGRR